MACGIKGGVTTCYDGPTMPKVTIHFPPEELEAVEDEVEQSLVHEDRSQFIRTACRTYLASTRDEFAESQ